mmetsp:Transcript_6327/g.13686  ORF Transcript_6327/g.13686 Transcript_6327/m.13686 type:complete len:215 (+) Transcript_6327:756-1400(+)
MAGQTHCLSDRCLHLQSWLCWRHEAPSCRAGHTRKAPRHHELLHDRSRETSRAPSLQRRLGSEDVHGRVLSARRHSRLDQPRAHMEPHILHKARTPTREQSCFGHDSDASRRDLQAGFDSVLVRQLGLLRHLLCREKHLSVAVHGDRHRPRGGYRLQQHLHHASGQPHIHAGVGAEADEPPEQRGEDRGPPHGDGVGPVYARAGHLWRRGKWRR